MTSGDCRRNWFSIICLCLCLATSAVRATTFLTLQSTYLGDGWFQYQMNVMNDPFFVAADITQLVIPFTNQIDQVAGNGWGYKSGHGWQFGGDYPGRPYSATFLARSSETSYRLAQITNWDGAAVFMSLGLTGLYPGSADGVFSQNIVGYARVSCLIPCSPEESDDSPTNFVFTLKLLPDVTINQLIQTNGNIYGVDFAWESPATFLLQGSSDLKKWDNINYLWTEPPETAWTTNAPLNPYGSYFRVELVSDGHLTNLPPLSGAVTEPFTSVKPKLPPVTPPKITGCQLAGDKVAVTLSAQAGETLQVEAMTSVGVVVQTQQVMASANSVTAYFDLASLPNTVLFQAVLE